MKQANKGLAIHLALALLSVAIISLPPTLAESQLPEVGGPEEPRSSCPNGQQNLGCGCGNSAPNVCGSCDGDLSCIPTEIPTATPIPVNTAIPTPIMTFIPANLCGADGWYEIPTSSFNALVGSKGSYDRGRNFVTVDWRNCPNQFVVNGTSNGGARISFENPVPGTMRFELRRRHQSHGHNYSIYGGLAWAFPQSPSSLTIAPSPGGSANHWGNYTFSCSNNASTAKQSCTFAYTTDQAPY